MKKRSVFSILSILLVGFLLISLVAGCSKKDTNEKQDQAVDNGTEDKVAEKETEYPEVYYEGFRLVEFTGETTEETYKEIQDYIAKQCGVKPVPIKLPRGSEREKLNLLISSKDERLDIFFSGDWREYYTTGILLPLNDLIEKHGPNIKKAWAKYEYMWDRVKDEKGNIWALPRALPTTSYPTWIRKDWLKKYNLEMPKTIDEFENILKTFKENDPAGNGQTIPLLTDLGGVYNAFSAGFTKYGFGNWKDTDGKIKHFILQPGFKDAIAKMAEWYKKGYVYKESYSINREQQEALVASNRVGSTMMWYSLIAVQGDELKKRIPEAEYDFCKGLKGPEGSVETKTNPGSAGMMILKKAKNPEAAMKLLDWVMSSREAFLTPLYGIKGVDWEYVDEEKGLIKRINERYNGDFYIYPNNVSLQQYGVVGEDGKPGMMTQFLMRYQYRYDDVKEPFDMHVDYPIDVLNELAPERADIDRMIQEEIVKFLTCVRPMEEWDNFINDLYKIGLEKLNDAYTQIYNNSVNK